MVGIQIRIRAKVIHSFVGMYWIKKQATGSMTFQSTTVMELRVQGMSNNFWTNRWLGTLLYNRVT